MFRDEGGVLRKERGIKLPEDAGDVEAAVFGEWVVAMDEQD